MRKFTSILSAMLVSAVVPQSVIAADNFGHVQQQQEYEQQQGQQQDQQQDFVEQQPQPQFQKKQPLQQQQQQQQTQLQQQVLQQQSALNSASSTTFRPVSQTRAFLPVTRPRRIAMYRPAYEHDDLLKSLNGWSATINIVITSPVSTKTAKIDDLVQGKLSQDFRWGPQLIAAKNSVVRGHVTEAQSGRTLTHSAVSSKRRLRTHGSLAIQFDEIIDTNGRRWPVRATPSPRQKNEGKEEHSTRRVLEVDPSGHIIKAEAELAGSLKATADATKVATMVPIPGTLIFSTLAPAVAMGAVGAASPSVAYDKPVDEDTDNRRVKGAAYGFFSNLPGAFVVKSVVEKGTEVALIPGDLLTLNVCIKETGHQLPRGEQLAVSGQVLARSRTHRLYPASH